MKKFFSVLLLLLLLSGCEGEGGINSSGAPNVPSVGEDSPTQYFIFNQVYTQLFYEEGKEKLFVYNDSENDEQVQVSMVNYSTGEYKFNAYKYSLLRNQAKTIEPKTEQNFCGSEDVCFEMHNGSKTLAHVLIDNELKSNKDPVVINSNMNIGHVGGALSLEMEQYFVSYNIDNEIIVTLKRSNISQIIIESTENVYGFSFVNVEVVEASNFNVSTYNSSIVLEPILQNTMDLTFKIKINSISLHPVEVLGYHILYSGGAGEVDQRIAFPLKD